MNFINCNSSPAIVFYRTDGVIEEPPINPEKLSSREQDFLHLSDEKKDWIDDRLEKCPLTKLQCDSDNQN